MSQNRITRRKALFALGAALPLARAAEGLLRVTRVDHVALAVGGMDEAMLFYRRLFGNEVLKDSRTPRRYLRLGPCYMAVAPANAGEGRRVDHFSVGIENFDAPALKSSLEKAGFQVRESNVGLFVTDPGGVSVQIWADRSWRLLTTAAPESGRKQEALFHPRGMHHVAIQTTDMARAKEFYRKLFGGESVNPSNPNQTAFVVGETRIILYDPKPDKPAKIDHFSVLVDNFDAPAALKVVKALGANAQLSKEGTLNEFYDPEGIRLQVTFPGQTYGTPATK